MKATVSARIGYVMKRYPRLTETFILNEIAVMEGLGADLELFSLLQPEPPPHHPMVREIQARLNHLPDAWPAAAVALVRAHSACIAHSPAGYARAVAAGLGATMRSTRPLAVWKQFLRAGFVADHCVRTGVTLLHGHFANAPTQVAWFASAMVGIPYSFTAHAKDLYLTAPHVIRRHVRGAAFVTTCTGFNADYLRAMVPERDRGKVRLVYHGIDLGRLAQRATPAPAQAGGAPLILSVGRLVPKKGLGDLVAACQALHQDGIRFRCMIVGEGPLRATLEADIERRGLSGLVALTGAMTHAKLIAIYREADVFALPPRVIADGDRDGIPNVIAEAMAIGVPVVSTSISGIPEIIEHGVTGLLVEPESPMQLTAAIRELLGNPDLGVRLARNARARLAQDFDCHETTKTLRDLMNACACGHDHERSAVPARSIADARGAAQTVA